MASCKKKKKKWRDSNIWQRKIREDLPLFVLCLGNRKTLHQLAKFAGHSPFRWPVNLISHHVLSQDPDTVCQALGVCQGDKFILQKMRLAKAKMAQASKLVSCRNVWRKILRNSHTSSRTTKEPKVTGDNYMTGTWRLQSVACSPRLSYRLHNCVFMSFTEESISLRGLWSDIPRIEDSLVGANSSTGCRELCQEEPVHQIRRLPENGKER